MSIPTLRTRLAIAAVTVLATGGALVASALPAGASTHAASSSRTATTVIKNRPDSGVHGNTWALDNITRTATVTRQAEVALSFCGGPTPTGHCYRYTGKITDSGSAFTIPGQMVPGNGGLNGGPVPVFGFRVKVPMTGFLNYSFYSSWKTFSASSVEKTENDGGNDPAGESTSGFWPAQFFGGGAKFYVNSVPATYLATSGSWTYTAAPGLDSACPNVSSRWVDAGSNVSQPAPDDWGVAASDGNIEAPAADAC